MKHWHDRLTQWASSGSNLRFWVFLIAYVLFTITAFAVSLYLLYQTSQL